MIRDTSLRLVCLILAVPTLLLASPDRQTRHQTRLGSPTLANRTEQIFALPFLAPLGSVPDIKISETTTPAMFSQDNVSLVKTTDNVWLAAWQDQRLGASKIFLQKFDSTGAFTGFNRLMASSQQGADYVDPQLAVDTLGRIYLFWRDLTHGYIFGSRYNSDLTVDLAPFLVNDTASGAFAGLFDYDIYPDGRLVIAWENYSTATGNTIKMRIYNPAGTSTLGPNTVNTDLGTAAHWSPDLAIQPGSGFLIAWEDYRSGNADIMARLFTGAGVGVTPEFGIVPPGPVDSSQYEPQVVYSSTEKYVIGWIDRRAGQEMYLQKYDPITGLVGSNVLASSGNTLLENWDLDLAVSPDGRVLATWGAYGPQASIVARRFNTGLVSIGAPISQNLSSTGQRWEPSAAFLSTAKYGIAWTESQSNDEDISFMLFDTTGARKLGAELTLNDDTQGAPNLEPYVANTTHWYDLIAFTSQRRDPGDIYVQAVSHALVRLYGNRKLNADIGNNLQDQPAIAVGHGDTNLVLWVDSRAISGIPGRRVFGRLVNDFGVTLGPEIVISDPVTGTYTEDPHGAVSTNGRILVTWIDSRSSGLTHVRGRWLTAAGALDGAEFIVSDMNTEYAPSNLFMGSDAAGRTYAVWLATTDVAQYVDGAWFDAGKALGGKFTYTPPAPLPRLDRISVEVSAAGTIALLFTVKDTMVYRLRVAAIDRSAVLLVAPTEVKTDTTAVARDFDVAIDEAGYITAVWTDQSSGVRRAYYQVISNTGLPLGSNQQVTNAPAEYMMQPSASASLGRVSFTWVDPRQDGDAVWGNNIVYQPTDIDTTGSTDNPRPLSFALYQNYPNPFNPSTEIKFALPSRSDITLDVFNLLGERVVTLAHGPLAAGTHTIIWNGTDSDGAPVSSGLYFYRLTTSAFTQTKKMLLVK